MPDSTQLNQSAQKVIKLLTPAVDDFFVCLQKESDTIAKGSAEELLILSEEKENAANQLEIATRSAQKLLQEAGQVDLEQLLKRQGMQPLLKPNAEALSKLNSKISECFDLNQANGIAIQTLNNINRHTLNLLTGQDREPQLYGSKGTPLNSSKTSGSKLGKA